MRRRSAAGACLSSTPIALQSYRTQFDSQFRNDYRMPEFCGSSTRNGVWEWLTSCPSISTRYFMLMLASIKAAKFSYLWNDRNCDGSALVYNIRKGIEAVNISLSLWCSGYFLSDCYGGYNSFVYSKNRRSFIMRSAASCIAGRNSSANITSTAVVVSENYS